MKPVAQGCGWYSFAVRNVDQTGTDGLNDSFSAVAGQLPTICAGIYREALRIRAEMAKGLNGRVLQQVNVSN